MKKFVIRLIIGMLIVYLVSAFVIWDLNPANWPLELRHECSFAVEVIAGVLAMLQFLFETLDITHSSRHTT